MLQIYTGNGKGKTTAALGLALRALGAGKKVLLIQFLKDGKSSEVKMIKKIKNFDFRSFGQRKFVDKNNLSQRDYNLAKQGFNFCQKAIQDKNYDLIILDEANLVLSFGLLDKREILNLIRQAPKKTEFILTGRFADRGISRSADLVTRMEEIKHYYQKNIKSRKGIEF